MAQENAAQFSLEEQGRILYHLGYGVLNVADFLAFGVPGMTEPMFLVASAMTRVPESRAANVRRLIGILDGLEQAQVDAAQYVTANVAGEIEINQNAFRQLEEQYRSWALRLADTMMCTLNPYSQRFQAGGSGKLPLVMRVRPTC